MEQVSGACHCGAAGWTIAGGPGSITACNCTLCRRFGALWAYDYEDRGIVTRGATRAYVHGSACEFHFCETCGCVMWWRGLRLEDDGSRRIAVNVRMAEPGAVAHLAIDHFDGLDTFEDLESDGKIVRDLWA